MDAMVCDLMEPDAIEELAQALIQRQQGVDILINNAGFSSKVRNPLYISAEEWRQVMDVNTLGPAMLTRALLGPMMDRGDGHVLMISSMAAIRPGPLSGVAYSSAKSASRAYMETISSQIRGNGIRCTSIFPGEVDTPILDNRPLVPNSEVRALMMQPEDISAAVMMSVLLPKRANVSEIAITATVPRNMTADVKASLERKE
jgi:short-subunit dehydrogenase